MQCGRWDTRREWHHFPQEDVFSGQQTYSSLSKFMFTSVVLVTSLRDTEKNTHPERDRYRERYTETGRKMQIVRQRGENQIRGECEGMSHSSDVLRHVSLNFQCRASDSHHELPLRVHSCFSLIMWKRWLLIRMLLLLKGLEPFSSFEKLLSFIYYF